MAYDYLEIYFGPPERVLSNGTVVYRTRPVATQYDWQQRIEQAIWDALVDWQANRAGGGWIALLRHVQSYINTHVPEAPCMSGELVERTCGLNIHPDDCKVTQAQWNSRYAGLACQSNPQNPTTLSWNLVRDAAGNWIPPEIRNP